RQIVETSRDSDGIDLRISALAQLGELVADTGDLAQARSFVDQAIATADRAGIDFERADCWVRLIKVLADHGSDMATAARRAPAADAAVARLGTRIDPRLKATWLYVQGSVLDEQHDVHGGAEKFRAATEPAAARRGEVTPLYVGALTALHGV